MKNSIRRKNKKGIILILLLIVAVLVTGGLCMLSGSSGMTVKEAFDALCFNGTAAHERIIWNIRIPRVLAAVIAGAGLSLSGILMQTTLNNPMASPSTLGVSNAAVFGANLSIIAFSGGFITTGNSISELSFGLNPYSTSLMAFIFSMLSVLGISALCRIRSFSPDVVVLAGIAAGSVWTAATTVLQFYATDVGISAAVVWSFGDLGRATYKTDAIMLAVVGVGFILSWLMSWRLNALLSGEAAARSMGIGVDLLRFSALVISSVITAVCVSFLGVIGFVGIICPHIVKKLTGQDHRFAVPLSALVGSLLLLAADTLSRSIGNGSALPVGAITTLLGAPFFIAIIFSQRGRV